MDITLVTLPPAFGLRNVSPFCLKTEMLLKQLELDFRLESLNDPRNAPKGKLPFLVVDGEKIADSERIALYLDERTDGRVFAGLSPEQRAVGTAFMRLAEDHLYWLMVTSRWLDDAWFPNIVRDFFGFVPWPVRSLAAGMARKQVARTLDLHGLGRHSLEEQKDFARSDLQALSDHVGAQRYIAGERLSLYDFAVAGLLTTGMENEPVTWFSEMANEFDELRAYNERIQSEIGVYAAR